MAMTVAISPNGGHNLPVRKFRLVILGLLLSTILHADIKIQVGGAFAIPTTDTIRRHFGTSMTSDLFIEHRLPFGFWKLRWTYGVLGQVAWMTHQTPRDYTIGVTPSAYVGHRILLGTFEPGIFLVGGTTTWLNNTTPGNWFLGPLAVGTFHFEDFLLSLHYQLRGTSDGRQHVTGFSMGWEL